MITTIDKFIAAYKKKLYILGQLYFFKVSISVKAHKKTPDLIIKQ